MHRFCLFHGRMLLRRRKTKGKKLLRQGGGAEFCRAARGKIERKKAQMKAGFHLRLFALGPAEGRAPRRPLKYSRVSFVFIRRGRLILPKISGLQKSTDAMNQGIPAINAHPSASAAL